MVEHGHRDQASKVAFALGGLGGFNAHSAGFLNAAKELGVKPSFITCTSGTIEWAALYLEGADLKAKIEEQIREDTKFGPPLEWLNSLWIGMFGDPGISRPAIPEYWHRWLTPPRQIGAEALLDRLVPGQLWVPTRPPELLAHYADVFNKSSIPVAFNSYHLATGQCYLHINEAARDFLNVRAYGEVGGLDKFMRITPEAVTGGLWLSLYGFDRNSPPGLVDGAYIRQIIISELHACDRIYAVKPQSTRWVGRLPQNYFEMQDFNTEAWMNSSFDAEVTEMAAINRLIKQGKLVDPGYHLVDLVTVQMNHQCRYFGFFAEKQEVYDQSYATSLDILVKHENLQAHRKGHPHQKGHELSAAV